jgi:ribosomal protein S18 acetylase RimI-like enzyme
MYAIRPYHPSDLTRLYLICLETVFGGLEVARQYNDPDLLGHFYAAPYAVLEPDLCFVLTDHGTPVGYILGTRDSRMFRERCELEWFPPLRERYAPPDEGDRSRDAGMIRLIHRGHDAALKFPDHPAHLHIDLLPSAQGGGHGRALMTRFLDQLRTLEVPGVHLGVGKQNAGAVAFYRRMGFTVLEELEWGYVFGMTL